MELDYMERAVTIMQAMLQRIQHIPFADWLATIKQSLIHLSQSAFAKQQLNKMPGSLFGASPSLSEVPAPVIQWQLAPVANNVSSLQASSTASSRQFQQAWHHIRQASDGEALNAIFPKPIETFFGDERPLPTVSSASPEKKSATPRTKSENTGITPVQAPGKTSVSASSVPLPVQVVPELITDDHGFAFMVRRNQFLSNSIKRLASQYFERSEIDEADRARDPVLRQALADTLRYQEHQTSLVAQPIESFSVQSDFEKSCEPPSASQQAKSASQTSWAETIAQSFMDDEMAGLAAKVERLNLALANAEPRPIYYP